MAMNSQSNIEQIEGVLNQRYWFHVDNENDVLYIRLNEERETVSYAEEDDSGVLILHAQQDDRVVGVTVMSWSKSYADLDWEHVLLQQASRWLIPAAA